METFAWNTLPMVTLCNNNRGVHPTGVTVDEMSSSSEGLGRLVFCEATIKCLLCIIANPSSKHDNHNDITRTNVYHFIEF
jgi:hypothetical protein